MAVAAVTTTAAGTITFLLPTTATTAQLPDYVLHPERYTCYPWAIP